MIFTLHLLMMMSFSQTYIGAIVTIHADLLHTLEDLIKQFNTSSDPNCKSF
jgi:hypothetical protein